MKTSLHGFFAQQQNEPLCDAAKPMILLTVTTDRTHEEV